DQAIESAEGAHCCCDGSLGSILRGHVGDDDFDVRRGTELFGESFETLPSSRHEDEAVPAAKTASHAFADPPARARDQHDRSFVAIVVHRAPQAAAWPNFARSAFLSGLPSGVCGIESMNSTNFGA